MTFVQEIEQHVHDMFEAATEVILKKDIDLAEFNLCVSTIMTTIDYLRAKRGDDER